MSAQPSATVFELPHTGRAAAETPAAQPDGAIVAGPALRSVGAMLGVVALVAGAVAIAWVPRYRPGSPLGYALGVAGGVTMLALLLYPLRKRLGFMQGWGRLKYWFMAHMIGGVLGPLLILLHASFRFGSFNAGVALGSMLLVVASGMVGRFLYRRIHHGLYGRRATLQEAQESLSTQLAALEPALQAMPAVGAQIHAYLQRAGAVPRDFLRRLVQVATLAPRRFATSRRIHRAAAAAAIGTPARDALLRAVDRALGAAQDAALFSLYERLFALWHAVHIPFLGMLAITALVHVVAVHAY